MKILMFSDLFGNHYSTFIYNEAVELQKKGHEVLYVCCNRINEQKFPFDNLIVLPFERNRVSTKVHFMAEKHDIFLSFFNPDFSRKFNSIIKKFQPDVIHCNFGYEALKVLDNVKKTDIPIFITFHGYDASFKLMRLSYVRKMREHLAKPNVHSIFVNNFFRKLFESKKIPVTQSSSIHCGIDCNLFRRKSIQHKKDPFVFLQVSRFFEKKGHSYTIMAFQKMLKDHPEFNGRLILAGDGPTLDQMQALTKELKLEDKIEFTGVVTPRQAIELMEKAHVFVHHSVTSANGDTEGITTSIMEAMAMELPVIATWHSGLPELIDDGVNGYLIKEKDVEQYAKRMWDITSWNYLPNNRYIIKEGFELQLYINNLEKEFARIAHVPLNDLVSAQMPLPAQVFSNHI